MSTVLLVSQDPAMRKVFEQVVVAHGHALEYRANLNGPETKLACRHWQALFVDLETASCKATWHDVVLRGAQTSPVVVIGKKGNEASARLVSKALSAGAVDFLMKPVSQQEIEAVALLLGL